MPQDGGRHGVIAGFGPLCPEPMRDYVRVMVALCLVWWCNVGSRVFINTYAVAAVRSAIPC